MFDHIEPSFLLIVFLLIIIVEFLFEKLLAYLNIKNISDELPERLKGIYDDEKYKKSVAYNRENARFGLITSVISFTMLITLIATGFFGYLDDQIHMYVSYPVYISLIFFGLLFIASDLLSTPFSMYSTFVIEEKYGFNKTSLKIFLTDKLKGYALSIVIGGGILYILLLLMTKMGSGFWIYFWMVIAGFTLFMNFFYTSLIVPIFNKLVPLEDGDLKRAITSYGYEVNFPVDNIYVIDGSKRSTKANAYFSGLGRKKKIILFDTLIKDHSIEELTAVLAHEVGHYKKKHVISGLVSSILQTGIILFIMSMFVFSPVLSEAMGSSHTSIHLNLLAFFILFSPISMVTGIVMNMISRKHEYQADRYAAETYKADPLKKALIKLSVNNLGNLTPHPLYVFVNYSHPPVLSRVKALETYASDGQEHDRE